MDRPIPIDYYYVRPVGSMMLTGQAPPASEQIMVSSFLGEFHIRASEHAITEGQDYVLKQAQPTLADLAGRPGLWVTVGRPVLPGALPDFQAKVTLPEDAAELGRTVADGIADIVEDSRFRSGEIAVERNESPSPAQLQRYTGDTEKLIGAVRNLLDAGAWASRPDVEQDIETSLQSLWHELYRPVDDRAPLIIEQLTTRLSRYVVEHEQATADEAQREALENLSDSVLGVFETLDGTSEDAEKIRPAVEELAGNLAWSSIQPPDDVEKERWADFIEYAEAHPVETLETAFGWRDKAEFAAAETKAEYLPLGLGDGVTIAGAVTSALLAGLGYGALTGLTVASAPIAAVAVMVLGTFAVNFRRATEEPDEN